MSLLAELRRRNVIRMAGLYFVGAWLIVQVAETVLPAFDVPTWVLRAIIIVLALGFVPALVFAWVFELTPGGLKRDGEVRLEESIAPQTARRMDRMIIAVLLLALAYFGFDRVVLAPRRDAALVSNTTAALTVKQATAPRTAATKAVPAGGAKSIAVLPFTNMSDESDNEFFSDGLSEEILNSLTRIDGMQVAGRTSSFRFKDTRKDLRNIGAQLGVAHVLEGSVRRGNDRARITAQLIRVSDGIHLWSQTYDRTLTDTLAVQLDIAENVAGALDVVMDEAQRERMREAGVKNVDAFIAFQRGSRLYDDAHSPERSDNLIATLRLAAVEFDRATALEPGFASAYYRGTDLYSHILMSETATDAEREAALLAERSKLDLALRNSRDRHGRLIIAVERQLVSDDWRGLAARFESAIEQEGDHQSNWMMVASAFGLAEKRLVATKRAIARDPLRLILYGNAAHAALWSGQPESALELVGEGNRATGGGATLATDGIKALIFLGRVDEARASLATLEADSVASTIGHLLVGAALGEDAAAINARLLRTRKPGWNPEYWTNVDALAEALANDRAAGNRRAAAIDARPGGALKLAVLVARCQCGAPFDLDATPIFKSRLEESGLPWPPPDLIANLRRKDATAK